MHAETPTKLSLYEWGRIIGIHPLHFAGVDLEDEAYKHPHCYQPWVQYEWQAGDRVGREAVARAIAMAEADIEQQLRYRLLPTWEANERHEATTLYTGLQHGDTRYMTNWRQVREGGCRATSELEIEQQTDPDPAPHLVDIFWDDGGYWQIGVVLVVIPEGLALDEIHLYYPGKGPDPTWEIRPCEITLEDATTARVTFPRECAVLEEFWNTLSPVAANGAEDADFLTTVDVYRVYNDPSCQVDYLWQPEGLCGCDGEGGCSGCTIRHQTGCFTVIDPQMGYVGTRPGAWADGAFTEGAWTYTRRPDGVALSYLGGYRDEGKTMPNREMADVFRRAVAFYACALLERPVCDCTVHTWARWRSVRGADARFEASARASGGASPFGPWEGAIHAWQMVTEYSDGQGAVRTR